MNTLLENKKTKKKLFDLYKLYYYLDNPNNINHDG